MKNLFKKAVLSLLVVVLAFSFITPVKVEAKTTSRKAQVRATLMKRIDRLDTKIGYYGWEVTKTNVKKSTKKEAIADVYCESPAKTFKKPVEIRVKRYGNNYITSYKYNGIKTTEKLIIKVCKQNRYDFDTES